MVLVVQDEAKKPDPIKYIIKIFQSLQYSYKIIKNLEFPIICYFY